MYEHKNAMRFRSGKVVQIGRATLTSAETIELRCLFDQVAGTCEVAGQVLGSAGQPPVGPALERLRELKAHAEAMVERLAAILD